MSEKKSDKTDTTDNAEKRSGTDTARRIWLAGIGAYGRAFTEAQEAIKDVTGSTSKVFDDLVQKGEMIETVVSAKGKQMMDKAQMPNFDLDDRIAKMRSRLSRGEDAAADMSSMEERMDAMEAKLDKILALLEPKKTTRKSPTKTKRTTKKS